VRHPAPHPRLHDGASTREDGAMPKFMGWIPFLVFVVGAAAGSVVGLMEFYS
jgi:hypothetical protein